jgi:phospholipid/cholesterol/gamma-HCH transport system ATP-binding protein
MSNARPAAVAFSHVSIAFDEQVVLRDLSFSLPTGTMSLLFGASGSGKSVILKLILGLLKPDSGIIEINGERIDTMSEHDLLKVRAGIGMVFQENALFDSLTVAENVGYQLVEEGRMSAAEVLGRVEEVLGFIGMADYVDRLPSELSGGQRRRVAIARAMAARPHLVLLDDPITGLDPVIATAVDDEIIKLRDVHHVTALAVTHQIRDAVYIARHKAVGTGDAVRIVEADASEAAQARYMVLHEGRMHFEGNVDALLSSPDPYLREYLLDTLPPW